MLKKIVRLAGALVFGALVWLGTAAPALAQYNSAGSEKAASPAVIAAVSSATASITAGGIASAIGGARGGFVSAGAQSANLKRHGSGDSGLGAAGHDKRFGVWINGGWTHIKNDFINTAFSGNSYIGGLGGDYRVLDNLVVGLTANFEDTDLKTSFNFGTFKTKGFGIGPYAAYTLNPNWFIDAFVTHSWLNNDVTRSNGSIQGDYDSNRWLGQTSLNGRLAVLDNVTVYPHVGLLYVHQKDKGYTETGSSSAVVDQAYVSLGQARAGAKVGYDFGTVEPFAGARYQYNFVNPEVNLPGVASPSKDRDSVNFQAGLKFKLSSSMTGEIEGNTTQFLKDTEQYGVLGTLKFAF